MSKNTFYFDATMAEKNGTVTEFNNLVWLILSFLFDMEADF